jgi:acyl carrier protein
MTVLARLEDVFRDIFADDDLTLTETTTAADIAGWDSLAHINLMFAIEQEFGIQFLNNTFAEFANIGELKAYLESHAIR